VTAVTARQSQQSSRFGNSATGKGDSLIKPFMKQRLLANLAHPGFLSKWKPQSQHSLAVPFFIEVADASQ
jgi:hypothetical protein